MSNSPFNDHFLPEKRPELRTDDMPASYFEKLPDIVIERIKSKELSEKPRHRSIGMIWRWAAAAVLVAGVVLTLLTPWRNKDGSADLVNSNSNTDEIAWYHFEDLDELAIYQTTQADDNWYLVLITQETSEIEINQE